MSEEAVNKDEYIKVGEARSEFNISHNKMTKLLKTGALPFISDEFDERIKWVKRGDVARLTAGSFKISQKDTHNNQKLEEPSFTFTAAQFTSLLYAFVPHVDAARNVFVSDADSIPAVLNAVNTVMRALEAARAAGISLDEVISEMWAPINRSDAMVLIAAQLEQIKVEQSVSYSDERHSIIS